MDVLKPDILEIDGIRYRINPGQGNTGRFSSARFEEPYYDQYDDTPSCEQFSDGDEDIEEIEGGRYKVSFHIAKSYFPYIIGSKGATKKRLETETRSKIIIPKPGQSGDIIVTAASKNNVASARRRIRLMVLSSRKRRPPTHFLSIPLNKPNIMKGYVNFKTEVLEKFGKDHGINENIFQEPEKLHLTIAVLALADEVEREEAGAALQECNEVVISPFLQSNNLRIEMRGIDIMNDDPANVYVLFGTVNVPNEEHSLQKLADGINSFFSRKGLLTRESNRVKLHCTLMNIKFLQRVDIAEEETEQFESGQKKSSEGFDASNIMKHFNNYYFGEDIINSIELSLFHYTKNEYYKATSFITIP